MAPWELEAQSLVWQHRALIAMVAEKEAKEAAENPQGTNGESLPKRLGQ